MWINWIDGYLMTIDDGILIDKLIMSTKRMMKMEFWHKVRRIEKKWILLISYLFSYFS